MCVVKSWFDEERLAARLRIGSSNGMRDRRMRGINLLALVSLFQDRGTVPAVKFLANECTARSPETNSLTGAASVSYARYMFAHNVSPPTSGISSV